MRAALVALAVGACGRIGFQARSDSGASGGDALADVPVDACTFGPWSAPAALTELNTTSNEYGPAIAADGLTLYFDSDKSGNADIYVATRPNVTAQFSPPVRLASIATAGMDQDAAPGPDQLELMYVNYTTKCMMDARRATTADAFGTVTQAFCMAGGPYMSRDGLTLYYNTIVDVFDEGILSVTTRQSTSVQFAAGMPIAELASGANKGFPALSDDGLTMYFESGQPLDLYMTTRASPTSPWGTPAPLTDLNTPMEDGDASITIDGTELFFESDRNGNPDLFHVTRTCL